MARTLIGVPLVEKNGCGAMNKTLFTRLLLTILGFLFSLKLALLLYLSLDEFTYTHAAWLVSQGKIPYRDFPLFHPPLLEIALSSVFFLTQSALKGVLFSRSIFAILLFATALLVKRESKSSIGFVLTLCLGVFSSWMTEIRPDSLALFLFLSANLSLSKKNYLFSGLLISLSLFSSEKALVYAPALIIPIIFERDLQALIRVIIPALLFSSIFYGGLVYIAGPNWVTEFLVTWAFQHETLYPKRSPWISLNQYLPQLILLIGLSLIRLKRELRLNLQWLVLFCLGGITYFLQRGPFSYSLLPVFLPLIILASKELAYIVEKLGSLERIDVVLTSILLSFLFFAPVYDQSNKNQLAALALIDLKVPQNACVYDNSGFAVTREHAGYWYFTDQLVRNKFMNQFENELPGLIQKKQCAAMILDERFSKLSMPLQTDLKTLFPKCQGLVCFRE